MPPSDADIIKLHSAYKALTGLDVPYTMQLRFTLEAFIAAGFGEPDLACVVRYLKKQIRDGRNPKESLLPRNLLQRTDIFGENLAIARAEARIKQPDARSRVLAQSGRPQQSSAPPKAVKSILEGDALKEFMRKCRAEAGI